MQHPAFTLAGKVFICLCVGWTVMLVAFIAGASLVPQYPGLVPNLLVALSVGDLTLYAWRWIKQRMEW